MSKTLDAQLKEEGYRQFGPVAFSEIPEFMKSLENVYGNSRRLINPIEEMRIIQANKVREDCNEYPNLYMVYVIVSGNRRKLLQKIIHE